jgi:hypothetical protein
VRAPPNPASLEDCLRNPVPLDGSSLNRTCGLRCHLRSDRPALMTGDLESAAALLSATNRAQHVSLAIRARTSGVISGAIAWRVSGRMDYNRRGAELPKRRRARECR